MPLKRVVAAIMLLLCLAWLLGVPRLDTVWRVVARAPGVLPQAAAPPSKEASTAPAAVAPPAKQPPTPAAAPAEPPTPAQSGLNPPLASGLLMDAGGGAILWEKDAHKQWAPASITKIMTLLLAFEAIEAGRAKLEDRVAISEKAYRMGGSQIWLDPRETMSLGDLLKAIALQSANDACVAVAEHLSGGEEAFVQKMNARAQALGMKETHFVNSHGLPVKDHYTTAYDLALLAREAVRHPKLLEFTGTWQEYLRNGRTWLVNTNWLVAHYKGVDGLKTGSTVEAKACVVATAEKDNLRLLAVVLGAPTGKQRFSAAADMLNWGFASYAGVPVAKAGDPVATVRVVGGDKEFMPIIVAADLTMAVSRGQDAGITKKTVVPRSVSAPISKGARLGEIQAVDKSGNVVGRVELVAADNARRIGALGLVRRLFFYTFKLGS